MKESIVTDTTDTPLEFDHELALQTALGQIDEADRSFESLSRMTDIHDTLSHWLRQSDSPSFESQSKTVFKLALAGTGIELDDISTEGAVETIKAIGKALLDMIKHIFNLIVDALSNFDLVATWLLRNIKLLERKRLTSRGKIPKTPSVTLPTTHRYLRIGRVFADEPVRLHSELVRLRAAIAVVSNELIPALAKGANAVNSRGSDKTGEDLEKALLDAVEDIGFNRIVNHLSMSSVSKDRWGRDGVKAAQPLLGGKSIFMLEGELSSRGVRGLRTHGLVYADTFRTPFPVADSRDFVTLTTSDLSGIPEVLEGIVMAISKAGSGAAISSLKQTRDTLDRYVTKRMNDSSLSEQDMRNLRSVTNAFTSWSKNVASPLFGTSINVVRAVLSYAQASTKTYN